MLVTAIVLITLALVFYTIGVWSEKRAGILKPWHAVMFILGLLCDGSGTFTMSLIAQSGQTIGNPTLNAVMSVTGTLALLLMAAHAIWALVVLGRQRGSEMRVFHRFSLVVWCVWLVPYIIGAITPMF
ncbi:MAG: TIGR03987 family protein [Bifidobacteriaceae bacterium]|jgi:uncharacterized repeat protein (TIGR03987 family)|nr:TIGR03987 family protein [Bifidobacteriaceae bacterium]